MKEFFKNTWKHRAYIVLALPVFLVLLFIMYIPMTGLWVAFEDYTVAGGIFGSKFYGLNNFKVLIASKDLFVRMTRNTFMYYVIFTVIGTLLNIILAIAIDQFVFKNFGKVMQTIMIIPVFISYAAVQFIVEAFLSSSTGLLNMTIFPFFGLKTVSFYKRAEFWPLILTIVKIWNGVGYGSVLYMSVLAGIDQEMYEAADIDGANKWQQIWNITIPMLIPMITVMLLLSVGGIMRSDSGLFYTVTRHTGKLLSTTETIDSYVLNALRTNPDFGMVAAVTFFQSIVGLIMMLVANLSVRKISPENALF